ncbi:MAG: SMP-30/Gluconolaconase/LRE domain protein [Bryobacterales bacterium]|nr:SMP-30/Gluconolaconase/LRE domain protein [Bryobacterales bacterium]
MDLLAGEGAIGSMETKYYVIPVSTLQTPTPNVIAGLPAASEWTNLRSLGAKGDGKTDDTAVIQKAIPDHRVIYGPVGNYVVGDAVSLRPDTVIIALHPEQAQVDLLDRTSGFQGPGTPRALVQTPQGGHNIVAGLGLFTNGFNSRAVGALWMAGKDSLMADVRFLGGHGTNGLKGLRLNSYTNAHTADPAIHRRWDSLYPSLWVTINCTGSFTLRGGPSSDGFHIRSERIDDGVVLIDKDDVDIVYLCADGNMILGQVGVDEGQHRTCATLTVITALLCSGEIQIFTQQVEQHCHGAT